jgi:hypothetical protein
MMRGSHYQEDAELLDKGDEYRRFLLERLELISDLSVSLRKSYTQNKADREDHHNLVSLAIETWEQIYPKIRNTALEDEFRKFLPFYENPRLFFLPGMTRRLWHLTFLIRLAYEELGLCRVGGK